jgi:hypothetical protein
MNCSKFDIAIYNRYLCLVTDINEKEISLTNLFEIHYEDRETTPAGKILSINAISSIENEDFRILGNIGILNDSDIEIAIDFSQKHLGNIMMGVASEYLDIKNGAIIKDEYGTFGLIKEISGGTGMFCSKTLDCSVINDNYYVENGVFSLIKKGSKLDLNVNSTSKANVIFFPQSTDWVDYELSYLLKILETIKNNFIQLKQES